MQTFECILRYAALAPLVFVPLAVASGQQTPDRSQVAVLRGVAIDSLRGGFLRDATVTVSGTGRMAVTDSLGRFRIDHVPPGAARLRVAHPVLDTIAMSLVTPEVTFKAGDSISLAVATPSAATVVSGKCTAAEREQGPAALFGQVLFAENEQPAVGARVSVRWMDILISGKRLQKTREERHGTVRADGLFSICGLPEDFRADVHATNGVDTTATVAIGFDGTFATVGFYLPLPGRAANPMVAAGEKPAASTTPRVPIRGRVTTRAGSGVAGARVASDGGSAYALTDGDGRFYLDSVRVGTRILTVRKIGYVPVELPVAATPRSDRPLTITMIDAVVLPTVEISARVRDLGLSRVGFSDRRRRGFGAYVDVNQIERRKPNDLVSLLTNVG